jgi:glycosyltransferase involved in cell wall biosynthesis
MPKISIVLPTYNGAKFLARSIESVQKQTESDWELIIVNDCSTDNTLDVAKHYAQQDKRISVITNKQNKKLPSSLNIGFEQAKGPYLTWTSDDNYYLPNALEKMTEVLDKDSGVSFVYSDLDYINEEGSFIKHGKLKEPETLFEGCCIGACFLYRREIWEKLGKYREDLFCAEDYEYWMRIYTAGFKMFHLSDVLYKYTQNSQSLTATKQNLVQDRTMAIKLEYMDKFHISNKKKAVSLFKQYKRTRDVNLLKIIKKLSPFWSNLWLLKLKLKGKK